jgi:hypothetical protein
VGKIPRQTGASFVRVRTLFRYLTGDRQAILELAADRHALWIGLLFVLSAGFAREVIRPDGFVAWRRAHASPSPRILLDRVLSRICCKAAAN